MGDTQWNIVNQLFGPPILPHASGIHMYGYRDLLTAKAKGEQTRKLTRKNPRTPGKEDGPTERTLEACRVGTEQIPTGTVDRDVSRCNAPHDKTA